MTQFKDGRGGVDGVLHGCTAKIMRSASGSKDVAMRGVRCTWHECHYLIIGLSLTYVYGTAAPSGGQKVACRSR